MEAALHALGQSHIPASITFYYDSQWAASMVTGKFKAKRNKALVSQAKKIYEHLKSKTLVQWRWVKGHSGEEYNDMADALAEAGKVDGEVVGGARPHASIRRQLCLRRVHRQQVHVKRWMSIRPRSLRL